MEEIVISSDDSSVEILQEGYSIPYCPVLKTTQHTNSNRSSTFCLILANSDAQLASLMRFNHIDFEKTFDDPYNRLTNLGLKNTLVDKLYEFQRYGVLWMYHTLYVKRCYDWSFNGVLLADDMGLGKTIQTCSLLNILFTRNHLFRVLLIMPKSLISNWESEISYWCPNARVYVLNTNKNQRLENSFSARRTGGIVICTYGFALPNIELLKNLGPGFGTDFTWDLIVLDEAHKMKNLNKTTRKISEIRTRKRLALTGTPFQNNLVELYTIMQYVSNGNIFGSKASFKSDFCSPIQSGTIKDAPPAFKKEAEKQLNKLRQMLKPFVLKRTKEEVFGQDAMNQVYDPRNKLDLVVWLKMSDFQVDVYRTFLQNVDIRTILMKVEKNRAAALAKLNILKIISNHPILAENFESVHEILKVAFYCYFNRQYNTVGLDEIYFKMTSKISFICSLLQKLLQDGENKILIFSESKRLINILNKFIYNYFQINVLQLDGTVNNREEIIELFQNGRSSYPLLLLTTKVGGVGLNLVSANHVIICEPSWNPGTENQAIDRIGQKRSVTVYRLIMCGNIEEKMFKRQILKQNLFTNLSEVKEGVESSVLSKMDVKEMLDLFTLGDFNRSNTFEEIFKHQKNPPQVQEKIDMILNLQNKYVYNVSNHLPNVNTNTNTNTPNGSSKNSTNQNPDRVITID